MLVQRWERKHIVVVGDVFLDHYVHGVAETNPDNSAVPKIRVMHEVYHPGGAGNVASNLASLGAYVSLIGVRGKDYGGNQLDEECKNRDIDPHWIVTSDPTIRKMRALASNPTHYMARIDFGESNLQPLATGAYQLLVQKVKERCTEGNVSALVLSDYAKYLYRTGMGKELIVYAREQKIPVFVDPKPCNVHQFAQATLIRPNLSEAEAILGGKQERDEIADLLHARFNCTYSVVTCGKDGLVASDGPNRYAIPSYARKAINHTGAGDTFMASLVLSLIHNNRFEDALHIASHAAAAVVEKPDTALVTQEELAERMTTYQ